MSGSAELSEVKGMCSCFVPQSEIVKFKYPLSKGSKLHSFTASFIVFNYGGEIKKGLNVTSVAGLVFFPLIRTPPPKVTSNDKCHNLYQNKHVFSPPSSYF